MTWYFKIMQDGLKVANGEAPKKNDCICEACHYFSMYAEEDFKKMTMEIKEKGSLADSE